MDINFLPDKYLRVLDQAPGVTKLDKLKFVIALFAESMNAKAARDKLKAAKNEG